MKAKHINLGRIHIESWNIGDKLFGDWMYEYQEEYKQEIEDTNPLEIILNPNTTYELIIDYPLNNSFKHSFETSEKGMSRKELIKLIVDSYHYVYAVEDDSVGHKTEEIPGTYNRQISNGTYGIRGHHLGDLMLHSAKIENNVIEIGVDS